MGLFDNRKKKKIINTIQLNNNSLEKIDDDFFNEYDYKVISKLEPNDYRLPIIYLRRLLDTIAIVGKKLNNIDVCQENFLVLQNMLKTKEDYLYLDSFCSKYNQNEIVNYIDENNPLSITDITVEKLDDFLKLKEFKKQKLTQNQYVPDIIKTYKDAINYEKINSYLSENGNFVNYFYKNFDWVNELCTSINFDELTQEQKNNLIDYFSLRTSTSIKIEINNYEDLLNYRTIKQEKLDETFNLDPKIALYYTIFKTENIYDIINTMQKCPKLSEINNIAPETLTNQFGFNPSEIEIVKILSTIQTKDKLKLSELYERYRNSENYIEVNTFEFQNKIRNIYGAEIATSLTKTTDDKKLKSLGSEKYGIPIYEKEDGEFKFLVHGIKKSLKLNIRIGSAIQDKTYFNNPELWDTLPKELGTNTLSTSIISSNGLTCFNSTNQDAVFYGFDEFESSSIRNISVTDGATKHDGDNIEAYGGGHETMMFSDELIEGNLSPNVAYKYNEVAFNRYNLDGTRKKPNFILCFDKINQESIIHAQYHQIPILIIKTKNYLKTAIDKLNASKEALIKCDKNNLEDYYKHLENYIREIKRYNSFVVENTHKKINEERLETVLNSLESAIRTKKSVDLQEKIEIIERDINLSHQTEEPPKSL